MYTHACDRAHCASCDREGVKYDREIDILGLGGCGLVLIQDTSGCQYVRSSRAAACRRPRLCRRGDDHVALDAGVIRERMSACASGDLQLPLA